TGFSAIAQNRYATVSLAPATRATTSFSPHFDIDAERPWGASWSTATRSSASGASARYSEAGQIGRQQCSCALGTSRLPSRAALSLVATVDNLEGIRSGRNSSYFTGISPAAGYKTHLIDR
ncbi:MAG TPA: hypothetical protein VFP68_12865, partial [Burkholderiaceae bacterium]|nr:hypothetical protein [Burkholderiaceae bacterium]